MPSTELARQMDVYRDITQRSDILTREHQGQVVMPLIKEIGEENRAIVLVLLQIRRALDDTDETGGWYVVSPNNDKNADPRLEDLNYRCFGRADLAGPIKEHGEWSLGREPQITQGGRGFSIVHSQAIIANTKDQVSGVHVEFKIIPTRGLGIAGVGRNGTHLCIKPLGTEFTSEAMIDGKPHKLVAPDLYHVNPHKGPTWLDYMSREIEEKHKAELAQRSRLSRWWDDMKKLGDGKKK